LARQRERETREGYPFVVFLLKCVSQPEQLVKGVIEMQLIIESNWWDSGGYKLNGSRFPVVMGPGPDNVQGVIGTPSLYQRLRDADQFIPVIPARTLLQCGNSLLEYRIYPA
jgi:hypothetical protein